MRAFALDHPLDHHRGGMGEERSHAGGKPRPTPSSLQQSAQCGHSDPADAVLAELR